MKQVIDGKLYDTEEATLVATYNPVKDRGDFSFLCEKLYRTDAGRYFIHGDGGPKTKYSQRVGTGETAGGSEIRPLSAEDALTWAENRSIDGSVVAEEFSDLVEKA
jgi:hypothetical protein